MYALALFRLRVWAAASSLVLFTLISSHAAVVAEWDFRANQKLTVAGGAASKEATFINGGKVNTGAAVGAGDRRIAEGHLESPRAAFNGSAATHHGVLTSGTFDQFFGTTALGEGTLVLVTRFRGNNLTHRKTLFGHEMGDPYANMWLYYNTSGTPTLTWRVAWQHANTRDANVPVTLEVGEWYLIVASWKAGQANQLAVRKIGTSTTLAAMGGGAISSTTANGCNGKFSLGARMDGATPSEGSDMDFAFAQLSNVRNTDVGGIYDALMTEEEVEEDSMGVGVTFRQDFPGSYAARVGSMTVAEPHASPTQNVALAPGLFSPGETILNSGVSIGDRPKQRLFCGTKGSIAPGFDTQGGTLSFYWSPDFSSEAGTPNLLTAPLWSTNSSGDAATFSGRWQHGKLIANFGLIESAVDMPVQAKRWYLITVSWGRWQQNAAQRGRVHWQEVKAGSVVQYDGDGVVVHGSAGHKLAWGDSELCVGSTVADQLDSGCRGTIDRVVYQDGVVVRSGGADGLYENTFAKYTANPLPAVAGAQEVQFPSSDLTLRGYPHNAVLRDDHQMTNLGTTTSVPGFRQLADPKKWDLAMKTAANGTTTGIGLDQSKVLPNALKTRGTIRLLYKPDLSQPTTGNATLISAGTTSSQYNGFRLYRQNQNKVIFEIDTQNSATPKTLSLTLGSANQFTDADSWYYISAAWVTGATSSSGRLRLYVRKMEPGLAPPAGDVIFANLLMPDAGNTLSSGVRLGARETNTENAKGAIDEVLFLDSTAWGSSDFDADYEKLRRANDFYDYRRSTGERVRYIPAEPLLKTSIEVANELFSPTGDNAHLGYQIPIEARDWLNYEPATDRAKRYYREEIIAKINPARHLVPSANNPSIADTSNANRAYNMLLWFGTETEFHDKAVEILGGAVSNFPFHQGDKAWAYGAILMSSGMPDLGDASLSPQTRSYDRYASSLIGAGTYLGDAAMVALGEKVMQTYRDSVYSQAIPVVPDHLTVGTEQSSVVLETTDSLYITNTAYWVWKATGNAVLEDMLVTTADAWAANAWVEAWGHSRRRVKVDGTLNTDERQSGDGKWNQLRGMAVGYPINHDPELVRKTEKAVEFMRASGRFGLYPASVYAGSADRDTFPSPGMDMYAWLDARQETTTDDADNNNISMSGATFVRDMLYAYDATQSGAFLTWSQDLAEAVIEAGRYYMHFGETINGFPRLAYLRGVCRVRVTGDLGDTLKVVKSLPGRTVVEKPVEEYDEAVVYLAPGEYEITASRNGSGTPVAVTVSGSSLSVVVDAP